MEIYLVGGAVRDELLSYPVYDKDWVVVGATPDEMLSQGFLPVGKDFPVFIHPSTGEEYALARTERKSGKGYTGFKYFAAPDVTLEEDLKRRDLTINAIAKSSDGQLIDPYHGQRDLELKILRHVSPAFEEDPLRVLRVGRFAARYTHMGFTVAHETLRLMQQLSTGDELEHLTAERVWKETERALAEKTPYAYVEILHLCGAVSALFPEWSPLFLTEGSARQLDNVLTQIHRISPNGQEAFSCLMTLATQDRNADQASQAINSFCQRLRTPKAWLEQALQVRQWHEMLSQFASLNGEQRFSVVQVLDLLRRPQRLEGIFNCCQALDDLSNPLRESINQLLDRLNTLEPKQVIAEGFKGKALGDELNRRRQLMCETL